MSYLSLISRDLKPKAPYLLSTIFLLITGCTTPNIIPQGDSTKITPNQKQSDIHPDVYCRIDMRVPRASPQPYLRYSGRVVETTDDEIVLANTLVESRIDDGKPMRRATPYLTNRGNVRIPRAEIATIQVYDVKDSSE
jgi:hypothetical protein